MLSFHREKIEDETDLNGLNIVSYCVQEYAWDCLSEITATFGSQILEKVDESTQMTPSQFAKSIGFEAEYLQWADTLLSGLKIDWRIKRDAEQSKTLIMFHGN